MNTSAKLSMNEQELREKMGAHIWQGVVDSEGEFTLGHADIIAKEILALIKEAGWRDLRDLELTNATLKAQGWVKLADDQTLLYNKYNSVPDNYTNQPRTSRQGYSEAQQDMLKAGWRKVER